MDYYLSEENCYKRLENEFIKYGKLIICVDFDDTIYDFHKTGRKYNDVISLLHRWENYSEVIIFTGAGKERYPEIEKYLSDNNIKYKGINCDSFNCTGGRKTYANVYIDDRGGLPLVYKMLDKLITKIEMGILTPEAFKKVATLVVSVSSKLSEKTIALPEIYSNLIKNKDRIIVAASPFCEYGRLINLSYFNVLSSFIKDDRCIVSADVAINMGLEFDEDILHFYGCSDSIK